MPPLHAAGLAALTRASRWNPIATLSVFCSLAIFLVLATRKWRKTSQIGAFATQHRLKREVKQDMKPHARSGDAESSEMSASQAFIYFPPPPGSILTTESRAGQVPLPHCNSGALAAQAMAKLWPDPTLASETEVRHPWRRHSHPLPKATSDDETNVFITRDTDQYFDDADLNGFWRRRTLEFG